MSERAATGAVAALMDEYERATAELIGILAGVSDAEFEAVRDPDTQDPDCRSIATVVRHVVRSGHGYADYMRVAFGAASDRGDLLLATREESIGSLRAMLGYMVATLDGHWQMTEEENNACVIKTRWGATFDFEQMFEHAIVHVLRHRRQIERFLGTWQPPRA